MAYDVVIVAGGGVRAGGELPPWVVPRLDRAIQRAGDSPILCLSAGTVHRPNPLDESGRVIYEAVAGARYLIKCGFDPKRIYIEAASWDTIGNAYFARTIHTDPSGWRRLLVITSDSHMPRTEAIFRWVFGVIPDRHYDLDFDSTPDRGLTPELLAARQSREAGSLRKVHQTAAGIRTLPDLHRWLFTEHQAYRTSLHAPEIASGPVTEAY